MAGEVQEIRMTDAEKLVDKYIILWRNEAKQTCKVLSVDKAEQKIRYELVAGTEAGKRFVSRYDSSQTIKAYDDSNLSLALLET
jgi:hypothetical protein